MKQAKQNQTQSCVELNRCSQVIDSDIDNDSNDNNYIESDNYELNNR